KRDFAVVPYATDPKQRKKKHSKKKEQNDDEQKKLIRDVDKSVKGLEFSAAEIAQVIRSWMKQDEDR
ncbi:MAG TPA: hypothetical protein PLQ76_03145, partial [bacterium]|nr:hypothetical protein [bacterium]